MLSSSQLVITATTRIAKPPLIRKIQLEDGAETQNLSICQDSDGYRVIIGEQSKIAGLAAVQQCQI